MCFRRRPYLDFPLCVRSAHVWPAMSWVPRSAGTGLPPSWRRVSPLYPSRPWSAGAVSPWTRTGQIQTSANGQRWANFSSMSRTAAPVGLVTRARRLGKRGSGFFDAHAAEVAQLHNARLIRIELGEPLQRIVERQHLHGVDVGGADRRCDVAQRDVLRGPSALGRESTARGRNTARNAPKTSGRLTAPARRRPARKRRAGRRRSFRRPAMPQPTLVGLNSLQQRV